MNVHVLYHSNCYDGFACAYITRFINPACILHPVAYGNPIPDIPDNQSIYILDFSYDRETLKKLADRSYQVIIIDHHKTAQFDLQNIVHPKLEIHFDMNESGATLTYKELVSPHVPMFFQYIKDRDLWEFKLPQSREISAWLKSYPMDLTIWGKIENDFKNHFVDCVTEGKSILRIQENETEIMAKNHIFKVIGGYEVPVANATILFSEVGEKLCKMYPDNPFAAYYLDRADGMRQWGLRSIGDFDVSAVAKQYGGGGHKNAAGFVQTNNWII